MYKTIERKLDSHENTLSEIYNFIDILVVKNEGMSYKGKEFWQLCTITSFIFSSEFLLLIDYAYFSS